MPTITHLALLALFVPQTPTLVPVAPAAPRQPAGPPAGIVAAKLVDQAGGALEASSTPTLGMLYPLSNTLFVDGTFGAVGVGTTTPSASLEVFGTFECGVSQYAGGVVCSVLGGSSNRIENGAACSIGGGTSNTITAVSSSFIGAGKDNLVQASYGTVGGGEDNQVVGSRGTIPGGWGNRAGSNSLAAGRGADATLDGCFVWADNSASGLPFAATATNQFLIRAAGGVGIGTDAPGSALDVAGIVRSTGSTGGSFTAYNPNAPGVSASLSWLNDVARIRVGGSGAGAQNGFDIQTVSNTSLLRITGGGDAIAKGQMQATAFVQTSDGRLKTDVRELEGALDTVRALRGVRFRWDRSLRPDAEAGERVGFVAQEVRAVLPEAVRESPDGMLAVSYAELVPVLVEALQEQQVEIDRLRELEARVLALETSLGGSR